MKKYILFDLDGTLTDPKEGITKCAQFALRNAGIEVDNPDDLLKFIGPPLDESFMKYYGMSEKEAWVAIDKFRERFRDVGIFENALFEGAAFCLETLKEAGLMIVLATSKPEEFAIRILEHYNIAKYFDIVVGSMMNGDRTKKQEVIKECIKQIYNINNSVDVNYDEIDSYDIEQIVADSIMIGDRKQDVNGAHYVGMECVGVTFGYAADNELEDAGVDYLVDTFPKLTAFILTDSY